MRHVPIACLFLLLATAATGQSAVSPPTAAPPPNAPRAVEPRVAGLFEVQNRRSPAATMAAGGNVVSAADPRAAAAGLAMLRAGGTAADAAAATAIALTVVEPQSSGLGGGGFALAHDAASGRLSAIDGREAAPAAARPDRFLQDGKPMSIRDAVWGGRSVGVPGLVALLGELHARHGRLPWARLFDPAIALARDGVVVTPRLARILASRREMVSASAVAARFQRPDGTMLRAGDRLVQPELAATLQALAAGGARSFYDGPIAAAVVQAVNAAPRGASPMTAADLAGYRVLHRNPVCAAYRGWRVCGMGPPSAGGIAMTQMLGILERHDMARLGPDNALSWHLLAEASRLAQADRAAFVADPGFAAVPADGLTDPTYVAGRAALVRIDRALADAPAGSPPGSPMPPAADAGAEAGTSHMVAADAAGNVVSLTSTIESIFGSGQVAGGFFLNNQLTDFDFAPTRADGRAAPNRLEPGKRPRSSMTPTILYAPDGRVAGAIGAAGGATIIAQVAKIVVGVIDWKLPIEQAIALPGLFAAGDRMSYEATGRFPAMAATWAALGHKPTVTDLPLKANGLMRDGMRPGVRWRGGADPRTDGQAVAWSAKGNSR